MATIENIYKNLISKLTSDGSVLRISRKLFMIKTNSDRVKFVYALLEENNMLPKIVEVRKCPAKSTKYRTKGNECFAKKCDIEALQYYNLSLLYAQPDSEELALAYSNRSAVLFSMGSYTEALNDVNRVLRMKYPAKLELKLLSRQKQCEENLVAIIEKNNKKVECKMYKAIKYDTVFDCARDCLEVVYNDNFGRHVVAKRDIQVGEVICIESPYTAQLLYSQLLLRCSHCLKRFGNLYPCQFCCYTMYCGKECSETAWNEYHKIECPMMASLYLLKLTKLELLALRIVVKSFSTLDFNNLMKKCESVEKSQQGIEYGCIQESNGKLIYNSKYYESIHALLSNVDKRSASDIFQKATTAAVFAHLWGRKDDVICSSLLHHGMTVPTNTHSLSIAAFNAEGHALDLIEYGAAAFAFLSLLNHSCAPNIVRVTPIFDYVGERKRNDLLAAVAILPIKKGEQILDNYGYHFAQMDLKNRLASLKFQYKFDCACYACKYNWPMYAQLKDLTLQQVAQHKNTLMALDDDTVLALRVGKTEGIFERAAKLTRMVGLLSKLNPRESPPPRPLAEAQEAFKQILEIIAGVEPHIYTKHLTRDQISSA